MAGLSIRFPSPERSVEEGSEEGGEASGVAFPNVNMLEVIKTELDVTGMR